MQVDEKQDVYGVENGEILHLMKCDTRGMVCMEMLNDTPGCVDKHQARQMAAIRLEKVIYGLDF